MAQSLRRPLFCIDGFSSSISRRQFTQIAPRWAGLQQPQAVRPMQKAEKSIKVLQREQMARGVIPSDMGLLDQTFVTPIIKLSTLFRNPRLFLRLHYTKIRSQLIAYASLMVVKQSSPQGGKRWYNKSYKMNRKAVGPVAVGLHTDMYSAFAKGDVGGLRQMCTDGLYESFRARIAARKKGEVWKWELLKYNKTPKVVSDRAAMIPGMDGMAIRQAVVRIASQQRLTRLLGGQKVEGTGEAKDVMEYVVVQSLVERWQPGEWKVWGTTKETTLQDVEEWQRRAGS